MVYDTSRFEPVEWNAPGRSDELETDGSTMLYLRAVAHTGTSLRIAFGSGARIYRLGRGRPFELRIPLADLGPGPVLTVEPANAIREARLFAATMR